MKTLMKESWLINADRMGKKHHCNVTVVIASCKIHKNFAKIIWTGV